MPSIDWPLEQLKQYQPPLYRETDFEDYWPRVVARNRRQADRIERVALERAAVVIFASDWGAQTAIEHYGAYYSSAFGGRFGSVPWHSRWRP